MDCRWWAGHLMLTKAQVSALPILQLISTGFLFGSEMRLVTNGLSQRCRISLCSYFSFPRFQMKGVHTPALPQQGSTSSYIPRCQKPLGLQSWALATQWLYGYAVSANLCFPMMKFQVYLVNSWAVSEVHYLNLEAPWDSPRGPLWCSSYIPYKDKPALW